MKKYLTIILALLSSGLMARDWEYKTPSPTIEAAQRSGLYEGVEISDQQSMPEKQLRHEEQMEENVDKQSDKPENEERKPLNPNP